MKVNDDEIRVRPMVPADVSRVVEIAKALPEAPQWPNAAYDRAVDAAAMPRRIALVAEVPSTQTVVGFAIAVYIPPEAELETIAVEAGTQGRGAGRGLLTALIERLGAKAVTEFGLEVRVSNARAIGLYQASGFKETGSRSRYYANPDEGAVLMRLALR